MSEPELQSQEKRTLVAKNFLLALLVVWMLLISGFLTLNALSATKTRSRLIDCTTPGGECYAEGQKNTAKAVQQLIDDNSNTQKVVLLVSICQKDLNTSSVRMLTKCVNEKLGIPNGLDTH